MGNSRGIWRAAIFFVLFLLLRSVLRLMLIPLPALSVRFSILIHAIASCAAVYGATYIMLRLDGGLRPMGWKHIGYNTDRNTLKRFGVGSIWGLCAVILLGVLCVVFDALGPIVGNMQGFDWILQPLISYAVFFIAALYEEGLIRGYLLHVLQDLGRLPALILSSAAFLCLHTGNAYMGVAPGINIFLAGMAMGIMVYCSGDIWMPLGFHVAWNFTMGAVLGSPVSGLPWPHSVLRMNSAQNFGLEGNVLCTAVLLCLCAFFFRRSRPGGAWKPLASEIWTARENEVIILGQQDDSEESQSLP